MNSRATETVVIGVGLAYLAAVGWAIANVSYDVWGALVVTPIYGLIGAAFVRRVFRGTLSPLATAMTWGLLIKLGGTLARYWVGFEAYDGAIDAGRYHRVASEAAGRIWSGEESWTTAIPRNQGTAFLEHFTTFVYTLTGTSQLAGFITFSFLAYIGTVLMVKAAAIAVPGLAAKRYAWLCVLFPSVVYWPASIGKESAIFLGLGVATIGIATMVTYGRWFSSIVLIGAGLGFTALVRPHIAGIWVAGAIPALVVSLIRRSSTAKGTRDGRKVSKIGTLVVLAVATIFLVVIAGVTTRYLAPASEETPASDSLSQILVETTRRTSDGGSNFTPPSVSSPASWPFASLRTLTRPLPQEARGIAQLVAATEMAVLVGIYFSCRRRLYNLPRMIVSIPYVTFAVTTVFLAGLAYSSFANLGVLTRQKSLIFPLLLLFPCLPAKRWSTPSDTRTSQSRLVEVAPISEQQTIAARPTSATTLAGRPSRRMEPPSTHSQEKDELWA